MRGTPTYPPAGLGTRRSVLATHGSAHRTGKPRAVDPVSRSLGISEPFLSYRFAMAEASGLWDWPPRRERLKRSFCGAGEPSDLISRRRLFSISHVVISPKASWPACSWRRKALTMSSVSSSIEVSATRMSTVTSPCWITLSRSHRAKRWA